MAKAKSKSTQHKADATDLGGPSAALAGDLPGGALHRHRAHRRRAFQHDQSQDQQPHPHADRRCRHRRRGRALRPGAGLRGLQEQVRAVRQGRARCGEARIRRASSTSRSSSTPTSIDRIYWDEPYYLAPSGKTGIDAFAVIRAAMEKKNKVALGRLVLHQREHVCALEPRDSGILLTTLRTPRRDPRHRRGVRPQPAQARPAHAADRREDHRAAGGQVRSDGIQGSLRRRAARPDRAQERRARSWSAARRPRKRTRWST